MSSQYPITANLINDTIETGTVAAVATTVVTAICGSVEDGKALAPLNAVSHILWGDSAARKEGLSGKYTVNGIALNAIAVTGWAGIHELVQDQILDNPSLPQSLLSGAAVSGLAFLTDYYLVPKRFTPGFEKRLSNTSLLAIYSVLALSLAFGSRQRGNGIFKQSRQ